jgi:hypothetical protein
MAENARVCRAETAEPGVEKSELIAELPVIQ